MSPQAGWILQEEIVPRLRHTIRHGVRAVGCEDLEELVQDGTAIAAKMLHSAEAAGKKVTPGNIAYYATAHLRSGRRSTGSSQTDVMQVATQLCGHTWLTSFEEPSAVNEETGGEIFTVHDVISTDTEDPLVVVARKLDWAALCAQLSERERCVVLFVAEGKTLQEAAKKFGLSYSTMQDGKERVRKSGRNHMKTTATTEVVSSPPGENERWNTKMASNHLLRRTKTGGGLKK